MTRLVARPTLGWSTCALSRLPPSPSPSPSRLPLPLRLPSRPLPLPPARSQAPQYRSTASPKVPPFHRPMKLIALWPAHSALAVLLDGYHSGGYGRCTGRTDSSASYDRSSTP